MTAPITPAGTEPAPRASGLPTWGYALLAVGVLLVGLRVFVFELFKLPSGSMLPTLAIGDHFVINKLSRSGERGSLVVFPYIDNPSQHFLKRVVAASGDTLEVRGGRPILDGWPVPRCAVGPLQYEGRSFELEMEYLGDAAYLILLDPTSAGDVQGPYRVAPGEVWVLGDNRHNSHDSRSWRGGVGAGVPLADVKGTLMGPSAASALPLDPAMAAKVAQCLKDRPAVTSPP